MPLPLAQHNGLQQLLQGLPAAPAASGIGGVFLPRTRLLDSLPWPTNKPTHSLPEVGKAIPAGVLRARPPEALGQTAGTASPVQQATYL